MREDGRFLNRKDRIEQITLHLFFSRPTIDSSFAEGAQKMDNDYSWTKFNPAAAQKLCAYSDRREELLSWLYSALPEETNYLHDPDHKKLTDIDPFTVFGVMNRHISQEKKAEVAKAFKIFFKVDEPSPTDFRGVSPLNNENSMFFGFKDGKTKEDINNLWTLFLGIFGQNNEVADLFNEMTRHQYGIKFNLTMGMYWVCPTKYFPLDGPSRKYLNARGVPVSEQVPSYDKFLKISEEVRQKLCGGSTADNAFAIVTRDIYYSTHKAQ